MFRSCFLYFAASLFIMGWWLFFFSQETPSTVSLKVPESRESLLKNTPFETLSPLCRNQIHDALSGDFDLMVQLMTIWDIEAQILEAEGVQNITRLPRESFLKAHIMGKKVKKLDLLQQKFLPQSYAAATILLSLVNPQQIVALPEGLRLQEHLFPRALTNQVPLSIDCYSSEELFLHRPDLAFVAPYSNPITVQMLKNQGIPQAVVPYPETLYEVENVIRETGRHCGASVQSELLALFYRASLYAIDNRIQALNTFLGDSRLHNVMFLSYHSAFAIPTERSLTGQLLARMGINPQSAEGGWRVMVDHETVNRQHPECLIISSECDERIRTMIYTTPSLKETPAVQGQRVFMVDECVQSSPTHFLALAYFDLYDALLKAHMQ